MTQAFLSHVDDTLAQIEAEQLTKRERLISSPQGGKITANGKPVINLCCLLYTSPSPRDLSTSRMPSSA